jgi:hypothetical protein
MPEAHILYPALFASARPFDGYALWDGHPYDETPIDIGRAGYFQGGQWVFVADLHLGSQAGNPVLGRMKGGEPYVAKSFSCKKLVAKACAR